MVNLLLMKLQHPCGESVAYETTINYHIYIYIYICMYICVCALRCKLCFFLVMCVCNFRTFFKYIHICSTSVIHVKLLTTDREI